MKKEKVSEGAEDQTKFQNNQNGPGKQETDKKKLKKKEVKPVLKNKPKLQPKAGRSKNKSGASCRGDDDGEGLYVNTNVENTCIKLDKLENYITRQCQLDGMTAEFQVRTERC